MLRTILIVDDNDVNLPPAKDVLLSCCRVFTLSSAAVMFELLENITPKFNTA